MGFSPNDGDTYDRNTFSLRGYANIDRFHLDMSLNYVRKDMRRSRDMYMELLRVLLMFAFHRYEGLQP